MYTNNYLFGKDIREEIEQNLQQAQFKSEKLNSHKGGILEFQQRKISLYTLQQAINLVAFYILQENIECKIEQMTESDLVQLYIKILIKLKSELSRPRSSFKVNFEGLGEIDSDEFKNDINKHAYKEIRSLYEWDKFMINMKLYFIENRHLNKLAKELKLIDREIPFTNNKKRILEARKIIHQILLNFSEEELKLINQNGRGHKGLKNAVYEKLTPSEYREYFGSNSGTFKNRWDEVRRAKNINILV